MSCCAQRVLAGRRVGCDKSGSAFDTPDTYAYLYNTRSELTNATAAVDSAYRYGYNFDDIGNRRSSLERRVQSAEYEANNLNQYTAVDDFTPAYDADGNETVVKTATGVWQVTYNGENRPMRWENGDTIITMSFDRMGRRVTKNDWRFVYNGYLQVGNFHCSTSTCRGEAERSRNLQPSTFIWDCTENVATRPLVWNKDGDASYYVFDGNKNVSEVIDSGNDVAAHYEYAPFGALTVSRGEDAAANPWRFSSEYAEADTATVYYNYRHYEPVMGRWMSRDPIGEEGGLSVYAFCKNSDLYYDLVGLRSSCCCKLCLYSATPRDLFKNGKPVDATRYDRAFGHTWVAKELCDTPKDQIGPFLGVISFGPVDFDEEKFRNGQLRGGEWPVSEYKPPLFVVLKRCWKLNSDQCSKLDAELNDPNKYPPYFTTTVYCTTVAVDFAKKMNVKGVPDAKGKVRISKAWGTTISRPNPKALAENMEKNGGIRIPDPTPKHNSTEKNAR